MNREVLSKENVRMCVCAMEMGIKECEGQRHFDMSNKFLPFLILHRGCVNTSV